MITDLIPEMPNGQTVVAWIITAGIAGIFFNLVSSFIFKKLDADLSKLSNRWRSSSEKKREKRKLLIESLVNKPERQATHFQNEIRAHFKSILWVIFGLFFISIMILSNAGSKHFGELEIHEIIFVLGLSLLGFLFLLMGSGQQTKAVGMADELIEARMIEMEIEQENRQITEKFKQESIKEKEL